MVVEPDRKQAAVNPRPPAFPVKVVLACYMTIASFEDSVGDGLSFKEGEEVTVSQMM